MFTHEKSLDGFLRLTGAKNNEVIIVRIGQIECIDRGILDEPKIESIPHEVTRINFINGNSICVGETPARIFELLGKE